MMHAGASGDRATAASLHSVWHANAVVACSRLPPANVVVQLRVDCGNDGDGSSGGYTSSSSARASLAETVGAGPHAHHEPEGSVDEAECWRTEHSGGKRSCKIHGDVGDESCDMDNSGGDEELEAKGWLAEHCEAANYQRFENIDLVLPASTEAAAERGSRRSRLFWLHTASNLEVLMALGLVERCSLVILEVQGEEMEEVEVDASRLYSAHPLNVCGLRIRADVDTMSAHCADCACCANTHGAASAEWYAWWDRALCLADYTSLLNAHNTWALGPREVTHDEEMSSPMQCDFEDESGFDLAFLGD